MYRIAKLKAIISLILILCISAIPVYATDSGEDIFTLSEIKVMVQTNHPDIKKQTEAIKLAELNKNDAESAYEIAKANYTNNIRQLREAVDAAKSAYNSAKYAYSDAKTALENTKLKIDFDVEKLYLTILYTDNNIKALEENNKLQQKLTNIEKIKMSLGISTQLQVDQQVQKNIALQKQLQELYDSAETLKYQLNRWMGRDLEITFKLAPVIFEPVIYSNNQGSEEKAIETSLAIYQYNRTIEDKIKDIDTKSEIGTDKVAKLEIEIKQVQYQKDDAEYNT